MWNRSWRKACGRRTIDDMTERRYRDDEVREIFSLATANDARDPSLSAESGGMTLGELKHIGQEAGIEPARVAAAAALLDAQMKVAPVRRSFGLPIGVSRVIDLPRAPSDREWEQLVSLFRTTFDTQGQMATSGGMREWSEGNLHITVEPTAHGQQLRLRTLNDSAMVLNVLGSLFGGMALLMGGVVAAAGKPEKALLVLGMFGTMAVVALGANVVRLPGWARKRDRQMEAIAEQAVRLLSTS